MTKIDLKKVFYDKERKELEGWLKKEKDNSKIMCPVCDSCGDQTCCLSSWCTQSPEGLYCDTNLKHLKFGYLMYLWFEENNIVPEVLMKAYKNEYDRVHKEIYGEDAV